MAKIGNYEILERLKSNAKRSIFRVMTPDGETAILKTLNQSLYSQIDLHKMKREYEFTKELDDDFVVKALEFGMLEGNAYVLSEDFGGVSLKDLLNTRTLSITEFSNYALKMIECLQYIHSHGIVHLDVNPSNFIINIKNNLVKLNDFGLSDYINRSSKSTADTDFHGTATYVSPEQTGRVNYPIDFRADLYSLGATFYEMLVGKPPFVTDKDNVLSLLHMHVAFQPKPPHEVKAIIPQVLSDMVVKLLNKSPNDRYQSIYGLREDLSKFKRMFDLGQVEAFKIAQKDVLGYFMMPQKRYGREIECEMALNVASRVQDNSSECLLLTGKTGSGKSFILNDLLSKFANENALVITCKSKVEHSSLFYGAVAKGVSQAIEKLLVDDEEDIYDVVESLKHELGPNLGLLTRLIPSLETLVGKVAYTGVFNPTEAMSRFNLSFGKLLNILARHHRWIVLAIDDLYLADDATINLLDELLESRVNRHLFVVGTINSETDFLEKNNHIVAFVNDIKVSRVDLSSLSLKNVEALTYECFKLPIAQNIILSEAIFHKTEGNPLYIEQVIKFLIDTKGLRFDSKSGKWEYSLEALQKLPITRNVVDNILKHHDMLDQHARRLLDACAVFSDDIPVSTVYDVLDLAYDDFVDALTICVDSGFLMTKGNLTELVLSRTLEHHDLRISYVEDAVKSAIFNKIDINQRKLLHYKVGKLYFATYQQVKSNRILKLLVYNLNLAVDLVEEVDMRIDLAKFNLELAKLSKEAIAFRASLIYLEHAVQALGQDAFDLDYTLAFEIYIERAELKYLNGEFEEAELEFDWLYNLSKSDLDKVRVNRIKIVLYVNRGETHQVVDLAVNTLKILDVQLHLKFSYHTLAQDLFKIKTSKYIKSPSEILRLPLSKNDKASLTLEVLNLLISVSYLIGKTLFMQIVFKMLLLSIEHGVMRLSPFAFATFGILESELFKNHANALRLGKTSIELARTLNDFEALSKSNFTVGFFLCHWINHISDSIPYLEEGRRYSSFSGDMVYYAYNTGGKYLAMLAAGMNLEKLDDEISEILKDKSVTRVKDISNLLWAIYHYVQVQISGDHKSVTMKYGTFEPLDFERKLSASKMPSILAHYLILKMKYLYTIGAYKEVVEITLTLKPLLGELMGLYIAVDYHYYNALARLHLNQTEGALLSLGDSVDQSLKHLKKFYKINPINFEHKYLHVQGVFYMQAKKYALAHEGLSDALESATRHVFSFEEALILMSLADLSLKHNDSRLYKVYLKEAYIAFRKIGCHTKCDQLMQVHQEISFIDVDMLTMDFTHSMHSSNKSTLHLDTLHIMKAAQRLSTEFSIESLLKVVLELLQEVVGSQRAILIFKNNALKIVAELRGEVYVYYDEGLVVHRSAKLPESVVNFVNRTLEETVIEDAQTNEQFKDDPYVRAHNIKSMLCQPIFKKGDHFGLLYMENNLMPKAFKAERLELITVILNQFTIAYDNAHLYTELEKSQANLLLHQENLEDLVKERTFELSKTKSDIENLLDNVGQGFLSVNAQGQINEAFSKECLAIFGHDITGESFPNLFMSAHETSEAKLLMKVIHRVFNMKNDKQTDAYLSLMPTLLEISNKVYACEYRYVNNIYVDQINVILTDITERVKLEKFMEEERHTLRMIVNVVRNQNSFKASIKRIRDFFDFDYERLLSISPFSEASCEVMRTLHTLKGDFAQWSLNQVASSLHEMETDIQTFFCDEKEADIQGKLKRYIQMVNIEGVLEEDLTTIEKYLGEGFVESNQVVQVDIEEYERIVNDLLALVPEAVYPQAKLLLQQFNEVGIFELLEQYNDYVINLAADFDKQINPLYLLGEDIWVNSTTFDGVLKNLVHIFRNAVQYGIETVDERAHLDKPIKGTITVEAADHGDTFELVIRDDGHGLNIEKIKTKAAQMQLDVEDMPLQDLKQLVFEGGLSTSDQVTSVSGRGVGLNALKQAVTRAGGQVTVYSEENEYTSFVIKLPYNLV